MMLPLERSHVLTHDIQRVQEADTIDEVVVATSTKTADDIIARYANRAGATVFRGSEDDVLDRMLSAATGANAETVVRITGDCPLIDWDVIDAVVDRLATENVDYCSNTVERTFPRGLDVEAFSYESFKHIHENAKEPHHREHVTTYYRENDDQFNLASVTSEEIFNRSWMQDRTDLRITLDEADDYELLREIYNRVEYEDTLPIRDAVSVIDDRDLHKLNADVTQK
ncbi:homolog to acylneuraminate cytidylyltransferase [Haloquadratum walsbyi C23]|uniref:Homolog to acylneuraminate cytidylyltransferase n=2 Tax=Haloquadratum walsbyi TaxID=293091 RepID=G0LM24_HALWC|nr:homolog to acylneuraminate cytidylyltransferase [Haloquadratum walsbyi C23]